MLVAELKKILPSRTDMDLLDQEQFPNFFPRVIKKRSFRLHKIPLSQF
jgi:hypothetical protein